MNVLKKVAKRVENSKIVKNPKFLVIGLIVIVVLITLIYFIFLKYSPIMNFKYEGYAISGKEITENLLGSSDISDDTNKNIELTKIEEQGTIFKKLNDYFVGNKEKTEINLNYPIYINGNSSLYNLSEGSTLISKNFEEISSYPNLSISEGKIYDGNNLERADAKEYIFVKTTDNIYINLYEIKIKTTANEYTIPVNSIIAFTENAIRYYSVNNNVLVFNQINDIDSNSNVQMVENNYTYEELLTRLGILQNESNNTQNTENTQTDIIQENTANEEVSKDNENIKNEQQNTDNNTNDQNGYIKPEVTVDNFTAEVYTAKSTLHIKDPSGRIVEAPTFEIYKDGKIYLRRTFSNSGEIQITGLIPDTEYEVVGKYIYLNENNQKVENTFYEGRFTTKGYEELGSIEITKENGEVFSNKIQVTKVKITSDLNAEVLKGVNQVEIETGEIRTVLKNNQVNELLQGKEITIESSEGLKSDSKINYAIKFYDNNGVELKVNNNEGETRTSKEAPIVRVSLKEQDIVNVTLGLKLTNRDNVELENYKYVVTRSNGEVVQEKKLIENENELLLENLDQNQYYKISIYADYDLNNNRGKQEQVEIGNLVFATQPISTLGSLELTVKNKELTSTTSMISYQIDEDRTDKRLIQILNELTINIVEQPAKNTEQDKKEGKIVYTDTLTGNEITNLQQAGTKEITYENLKSNTTYTIEITGKVQLGNTQEEIPITYNYKEFTTLKIPAKVEIRNQFVTGNLIDFDVRIEDINNAVLNNKVRMELRNSSNDLIDLQELTTNEDYMRKTYEKLEENQTYTLRFYADQYNEGSTDETYKVNYLIKEMKILTEPGISGSIGLTELSRKATGKNLLDMSSDIKWYIQTFNTNDYYGKEYDKETKIITLGRNESSATTIVYDLREYIGQEITISFKAKRLIGTGIIQLQKSKSNSNTRINIEGLTAEWKDFQYTLTIDSTGYVGFYIPANNQIQIKEVQVELGNQKTSYEEFKYTLQSNYSINLEDRRDEIPTNDYYIKVYEDENLITTDRYEEIPKENIITNAIKTYETESGKQYNVELVTRIRDREYVLSEFEYDTEDTEEIKGIYTAEEFREIQPKGHYIVLRDIDLAEGTGGRVNRFGWYYQRQLMFEGSINFNGNKLITDYQNSESIFNGISEEGVIENIVLEVRLNNELEISTFYGLTYTNYGTIRNIVVNLIECTEVQNQNIYLIGGSNYGTLENFVIHNSTPLYGNSNLTMGFANNYGTIKNGYIYGENIEIKGTLLSNDRNVGGLVIGSSSRGLIKNVYSLIKINSETQNNSKNEGVGNIIKTNAAEVNNIYSVESGNTIDFNHGPTIAYNTGKVSNAYYFSEQLFNNNYNSKTTRLALYDDTFQNQMLNDEGKFDVDELLKMEYYPQLIMPECMPNQTYINLPEIQDEDLPDVITTEIISQESASAKVKFIISNRSADTISEIKVQNIDCTIESQNYNNGVTEVIAEISNPILYVSNYSLESISTKNQFNMTYTRDFKTGERNIAIEFYREINSVDDWYDMNNSTTENYRLMQDLDFINNQNKICIGNALTGKIDGNNHTISNIQNTHIFYNIKGSLKNLNISNVSMYNTATSLGIIFNANSAEINSVTVDNINIESASIDKDASFNIGGLIIYSNNSKIQNCSVNDINITVKNTKKSIIMGGVIAQSNSDYIYNCYVNNINIKESNTINSSGIGAIIGYSTNSEVANCYSVGNIVADSKNIGGIIGYLTGVSSRLNYSYSLINIAGNNENIGGIVGFDGNSDLDNNISYNLSLGNIYNAKDTETSNRCVGNSPEERLNYAYENQLINGEESRESLGAEKLLTYKELTNVNTYLNVLLFSNSYSYIDITDGILPKLYDTEQKEILIKQVDIEIPNNNDLKIENVEVEKNSVNTVRGRVVITNLNEVEINDLNIEDMNVQINGITLENKKTYIDFTGTPTRYYDSYKIDSISYLYNGEKKQKTLEGKISIQFFKDIYNYQDWQSIEIGTYQNYRLMEDIDFSGRNDIKLDVTIGRLEGNNKKLKNIDITIDGNNSGFIYWVRDSMNNVIFENISIMNSSSKNYVGIISRSTAEINNLQFTRINIENKENTTGTGRGVIAINYGNISNLILSDITLKCDKSNNIGVIGENSDNAININNVSSNNIKCFGNNYVGSIVGIKGNVVNVDAEEIHIEATGNYIGGIAGFMNGSNDNISIKNSFISGKDYVGGAFGYAGGRLINGENIEVYGNNYVGGIFGKMIDGIDGQYILIQNSNIEGTGNYIGGIAGTSADAYGAGCYVNNCEINAESINSNYVGGVFGEYTGNQNMNYRIIANSQIKGTASSVGGIIGYLNGSKLYGGVAYDTKILGNENVGGIIGKFRKGELRLSYANCEIDGINNIGGIVGYLDNADMTAAVNTSKMYECYTVSNIKGNSNVGGLIGNLYNSLYKPEEFYYSNYVDVNIISNNSSSTSIGIAGKTNQNQYLKDTYYYKYSNINGENPNIQNEMFISSDKYLVEADLKQQSTYKSKLKWSTSWNFTILSNNKYPILNGSSKIEQVGIDLPIDFEHIVENNVDTNSEETNNLTEELEQIFEYSGKEIETYSTYSAITAEDGSRVTRNAKLYVKDNNLYAISSVLNANDETEVVPIANNLILDSYNGKEYETVLGSDGKLYDLKDPIEYPENFINSDIESIGNNLNNDSHEVEVIYKNGDKIKFNYQTGKVISSNKANTEELGLFDYLKEKISKIGDSTSKKVSEEIMSEYENSKELQTKLEKTSVEEAKEKQNNSNYLEKGVTTTENNATNNSFKENKYISMYNEETGEYEIYNEEELLDTNKEEVVSENEKIEANNLSEYYASEGETRSTKMGIVWIVISIIGVGIILFILKRNLKKKA